MFLSNSTLTSLVLACSAATIMCVVVSPAAAQTAGDGSDERSMRALRLDAGESIDLDGAIAEGVWRRAEPATEFLQQEPIEGAEPSESTEVYVVYDDAHLYIGAILYDSDPDGILAHQKERDAGLGTDDRFMWILDTFRDGRTGYFFEINPAGLMGDGLLTGAGFGVNKSWDGIWEARVHRRRDGWSAEIQIPFRTLNFSRANDTWGINFQRTVRRKQEEILWSGHRQNQELTRPVHAGTVTGLDDLSQGVGLELVPYGLASWRRAPDALDPTQYPADIGGELSYNITPSLRASFTVNTDFAEVEVDQRRVNLTRFPLRFPERRDFFLEGSGVYSFAPRNGVEPYFSRNIGLAEGGPVPILYGARLGGQAGKFELGFQHVRTGSDVRIDDENASFEIPGETFTIARVKRTLFEQSSLGVIYTRRETHIDSGAVSPRPDRHTVGVDLDLFTSQFLGDKNFQFEAFVVWNSDPDPLGTTSAASRTARGIRINYPNDVWRMHSSYRELPEGHDPAVGFTSRNGFRRWQPTIVWAPRPSISWIRQFEFEIQYEHLMNWEWNLETRSTTLKPLGIRFESGDELEFEVEQLLERLEPEDEFEIGGVTIEAGDYHTVTWSGQLETARQRAVSAEASVSVGEFWSGTRNEYRFDVTVRPASGVSVGIEYEFNDVELQGGSFTTNVVQLESGWDFSPWLSFTSNVQYDDVSEIVGVYARLRWIIQPGSDLFLVYTHNWLNTGARLLDFDGRTMSQGAATKLTYTYRF